MAKSDDERVTFVKTERPKDRGYGQFGEESPRPSAPKPASPPPAQKSVSHGTEE